MTQRQERLLKHNEINILKSSCPAQTQKIPAFKQCFSQSFIIMCCIFNKLSLTKYLIYRNDVFTIITRFLMLWLLRSIYYKVPALLSNEKKKKQKREKQKFLLQKKWTLSRRPILCHRYRCYRNIWKHFTFFYHWSQYYLLFKTFVPGDLPLVTD